MSTQQAIDEIRDQLEAFSVGSYMYQSSIATAFSLHPTDLLAIHFLGQKGDMTAGQLGTHLGLTSGATTALVDRLVKLKFVKRANSPSDRRRVYIQLNQPKIQLLKSKYQAIDQKLEDILGNYPEAHAQVISQFLKSLSKNITTHENSPGGPPRAN